MGVNLEKKSCPTFFLLNEFMKDEGTIFNENLVMSYDNLLFAFLLFL